MNSEVAILVYQSLEELVYDTYTNPLIQWHARDHGDVPLFHIDSFSDKSSFSYADKLMQETERLLLVTLFDQSKNMRGLTGILRKASRSSGVSIMSLSSTDTILKLSGPEKPKVLDTYADLQKAIAAWLHRNEKGSASF